MKKITFLLFSFLVALMAKADLEHYAWELNLGESIKMKLELQENSFGVLAGQSTYYRKNGSESVISVFGFRLDQDEDVVFAVKEYDGTKICGDITLYLNSGSIREGFWAMGEKSYEMNNIEVLEPDYSKRFFHPATSASKAVGEYAFNYEGGNGDELGGHCDLKLAGNRLRWEMAQVTPNIAEGSGTSVFKDAGFIGRVSNFEFEAYVDERFVYVKRTNPEDGAVDDWGAWATLQGLYVRKGMKTTSATPAKTTASPASTSKKPIDGLENWKTAEYFTDDDRQDLSHDFYGDALNYLTEHWNSNNDAECQNAKKLLSAKPLPLKASELQGYGRVRSIQMKSDDVYTYNYFKCRFTWEVDNLFFEKTTGSQRKWGQLFRMNDYYINLTGCYYYEGDEITYYRDESKLVVGQLKKVAANKVVMLFRGKDGFELYEFAK